jgi:hypothetical protein
MPLDRSNCPTATNCGALATRVVTLSIVMNAPSVSMRFSQKPRAKVRRVLERALLALAHELVLMAREVGA